MPPPGQPQRALSSSPNILSSSFNPANLQDLNTGIVHAPIINTTFIKAVAESMGFQTADEAYRSSLHSIPMVAMLTHVG